MAESVALKGMPLENKLAFMLDKTYEVLAEVGYNQVTLDMVAERVGVSKGTISYHFKNKEQLMVNTAAHISEVFFLSVESHCNGATDPKQKLLNFVESIWFTYWHNDKYPHIFKVYFDLWFHGIHSKPLYDATTVIDERFYSVFSELLTGIYEEKGAEADIFTKAIMISAAVDGSAKIVLSGSEDVDPGRLLKELMATVSKIIE